LGGFEGQSGAEMEPDGCRYEIDMISHYSFYIGYPWNTWVYDMRENKPYTGSDSLPDIAVDTGKPRKSLLFCSCGKYAQISL
jgi:hypothetical protein